MKTHREIALKLTSIADCEIQADRIEDAIDAAEQRGYQRAIDALREASLRLPGEFRSVESDRLRSACEYLEQMREK